MAFGSKIDTSNIDVAFPSLKHKNSAEGFHDNFSEIAKNLDVAKEELSIIHNKQIVAEGDVVGKSSFISSAEAPITLKLELDETGVVAGTYEASRITVDEKGRIVHVEDGSQTFVNQTGDVMTGDLVMQEADIILDEGRLVSGRDLHKDGKIIDQLTKKQGILVGQGNGFFTGRHLEVTDGLELANHDGVQGPITLGLKPYTITLHGDVKGSVRVKGGDTAAEIKLNTADVLSAKGGKMYGTLDMTGNYIKGAKNPIYGSHIGNREYNDSRYLMTTLGGASGFVSQRRPGQESVAREFKGTNGISIKNADGFNGNPEFTADDFKISLQGDVRGSGVVVGLSDVKIITSLPNYFTKDETDLRYINKTGDALDGDLSIRGDIIFPDGTSTVDGRNISEDGIKLDQLLTANGLVTLENGQFTGRALVGRENQIVITNGAGQKGNPTISIASDPKFTGRSGMRIPAGTINERPAHEDTIVRMNLTNGCLEISKNNTWADVPVVVHGKFADVGDTHHWDMSRQTSMTINTSQQSVLTASGFLAGHSYKLFIHQQGGGEITFGDMFKFPGGDPRLTQEQGTDVIEFHCDGEFLFGFIRHNFK